MWISNEGEHRDCPLVDPQQLSGRMTKDGHPIYILQDGKPLHIVSTRQHWVVANEFGHRGIAGCAWEVIMSDGSFWWLYRDLNNGRWLGEPM